MDLPLEEPGIWNEVFVLLAAPKLKTGAFLAEVSALESVIQDIMIHAL